jgi:hypothetical protein
MPGMEVFNPEIGGTNGELPVAKTNSSYSCHVVQMAIVVVIDFDS